MHTDHDVASDQVRRELRQSQLDHTSAMQAMRGLVSRLFDGGALGRRHFLQLGGLTAASAAVFAACGGDDDEGVADDEAGGGDDEGAGGDQNDIAILRTAASVELVVVDVYQKAIDSGLVTTTAIADAAKLFQEQHRDHAGLFNGAAKAAGGEAFEQPNPVILQSLQGPLSQLKDEAGVVTLALQLENAATATYLSSVGMFKDPALNRAAMSVGGVEARHAAVLAAVLQQPSVPKAFATKDGAITPGTGV